MVNVTQLNFLEQSQDFIRQVGTADVVAMDEEMTGIQLPPSSSSSTWASPKEAPPVSQYAHLKQVPEKYHLIQWGLVLFHRRSSPPAAAFPVENPPPDDDEEGEIPEAPREAAPEMVAPEPPAAGPPHLHPPPAWMEPGWDVRRYNFYVFPSSSSPQPSSHPGRGSNSFNPVPPRDVVLNPSTVAFLHQHGMSFDLWTQQGIAYPTTGLAALPEALSQFRAKVLEERRAAREQARSAGAPSAPEVAQRRIELRRVEDMEFCARTMATLREWLDGAHPPDLLDGRSLLLPACNSFLRRALYEAIGKEYPALDLEPAGADYPNQIRVWRLNEAEKAARQAQLEQESHQQFLLHTVGLARIFLALSLACRGVPIPMQSILFAPSFHLVDWERPIDEDLLRDHFDLEPVDPPSTPLPPPAAAAAAQYIPLIVHNGMMDLLFVMSHFHCHPLPDSYAECKAAIHRYFPCLYDTKVLSTQYTTAWSHEYSNLSSLFQRAESEQPFLMERLHPVAAIRQNENEDEGPPPDREHEAAYDAYMTGAVFLALCHIIVKERGGDDLYRHFVRAGGSLARALGRPSSTGWPRSLFGCNLAYQTSMYTMDMQTGMEDPLRRGMLACTSYRVTGIDPSVATRDIVRCLSPLTDSSGRNVNFEIVWINDVTFVVAARYRHHASAASSAAAAHDAGESKDDLADDSDVTMATLHEHGPLIYRALRERFHKEEIERFDQFIAAQAKGAKVITPSQTDAGWWEKFLSWLGRGPQRVTSTGDMDGPSRKRPRTD